jgi:hypothetical protein
MMWWLSLPMRKGNSHYGSRFGLIHARSVAIKTAAVLWSDSPIFTVVRELIGRQPVGEFGS